jgi:hypothetical protein
MKKRFEQEQTEDTEQRGGNVAVEYENATNLAPGL